MYGSKFFFSFFKRKTNGTKFVDWLVKHSSVYYILFCQTLPRNWVINTINPFQAVSIYQSLQHKCFEDPPEKKENVISLSLEATLLKYLFSLGTGRLTKRMKINFQMGGCCNPLMRTCCCDSDKVTRSLAGKWYTFVGISWFPVYSTTCILWSSFMVTLTLTGSWIFQKWWQYEWCWDCWKTLILWRKQALLWVDLTSLHQ